MRIPRADEQAAVDAICVVEDVVGDPEHEPNGKYTAPDWRLALADGRIVDVEVTSSTDGEAARFFHALHDDGTPRVWSDKRLSHRWPVWVSDHSRRYDERCSVTEMIGALIDRLRFVEALGGTPEQLAHRARTELITPQTFFNSPRGHEVLMHVVRSGRPLDDWLANGAPGSDYWHPPLLLNYHRGDKSLVQVGVMGVPEPLGKGNGRVETHGGPGESGSGCDSLAPVIQHRIEAKPEQHWMDNAPGLKWLAVILEGIPGFQLAHHCDPHSRVSLPTLEGISFSCFDEVWAIAHYGENRTVLRLSEGGTNQQPYVVLRV